MLRRDDSPIGDIALSFFGVSVSNLVSPISSKVHYEEKKIDLTFLTLLHVLMALN